MKVIRASEIGTYQFCQRAWWYQLQGYKPANQSELAGGSAIHEKHSRQVLASNCVQVIAYIALLLTILTALLWIIQAKL